MRPAFFALCLVLAGCATARNPRAVPSVPFFPQQPNECGPAALAMVASYYGANVQPDEISRSIYLPEIRGTLTVELEQYAKRFGFWVRSARDTRTGLRDKLAAGVPVILLGKFGEMYHYFVVLDWDHTGRQFTVHSDQRAFLRIPEEELLRRWDRADQWSLVVCPPDRVKWRLTAAEQNDLGYYWENTGDLMRAMGHYRAACDLAPVNSFYCMNLGNVLLKQRLFREAAGAFREAVSREPENADAWNNLAWAYHELGANLDEAIVACKRAIELRPSHRMYYLDTLASIYRQQGRREEAIATWEQALAAAGENASRLRESIRQQLDALRR